MGLVDDIERPRVRQLAHQAHLLAKASYRGYKREQRTWLFLGCSLGQVSEYTSLAVIEQTRHHDKAPEYSLVHLERLPQNTSYVDMVALLKLRLQAIPTQYRNYTSPDYGENGDAPLEVVLDTSSIGRSVVDMFAPLKPVRIAVTGGTTGTRRSGMCQARSRRPSTSHVRVSTTTSC